MKQLHDKQMMRGKLVDEQTLVVGADVDQDFSSFVAVDWGGHILQLLTKVRSNSSGYEWTMQQIRAIKRSNGFERIVMGLQPKGLCWRRLYDKVGSEGIEVVFVKRPAASLRRILDHHYSTQCSVKTAKLIATLVRRGKCRNIITQQAVSRFPGGSGQALATASPV